MTSSNDDTSWHLDRRVPIALIVSIIVQMVVAIWWASALDSRVDSVEKWIASNGRVDARLAVIEQQQIDIKNALVRIQDRLDDANGLPPSRGIIP